MIIAYLTSQYARAGDTFIRGEVAALRQQGHTVHTFSIRRASDQAVSEPIQHEQANTDYILEQSPFVLLSAFIVFLWHRPKHAARTMRLAWQLRSSGVKSLLWHLVYLFEASYLAKQLQKQGVEHLHNHIPENSATVALLASTLSEVPWSMTVHGPGIFYHPQKHALSKKLARAQFTACISHYCRSQCMMFVDSKHWPRLHLVRCGVAPAFSESEPTPAPSEPTLVSVGRLCTEKGQLQLIDAMAQLKAQAIAGRLVLIGDGPMRQAIETRIAQHELEDHIELQGWADSEAVRQTLERSWALVLPSFAEGLPIVLMEALASGRPVISTYIAGIPELVEPGNYGWLVPAGDVVSLTEAMREALTLSPQQLTEMGQRGREKVLQRHDAAANAQELARLFAAYSGGTGSTNADLQSAKRRKAESVAV